MKLLMKMYDHYEGTIQIGTTDIKDIPIKQLSEHISVLSQHSYIFSSSFVDHFRWVKSDVTQVEVESICKKVLLHDYIMSLPYGYNTIINSQMCKLSGGMSQRLAVARVLIRNSPIIIFDEIENSLDIESKEVYRKILQDLSKDHTIIVITHNHKSLFNFDAILKVKNGELFLDNISQTQKV
nr:ATP-binding cassette domain-containing protein [Thiospirochaeta perfilievii]